MNKIVKKAIEINQFTNDLPELEIDDIVILGKVWDGNGETPKNSYSYKLTDSDWINYEFEVIDPVMLTDGLSRSNFSIIQLTMFEIF